MGIQDDPYAVPEADVDPGAAEPSSGPGAERALGATRLNRSGSLFLTAVIALAGASLAQAATLAATLLFAPRGIPTPYVGPCWAWLMLAGPAACCGLYGGYRALRRGSVSGPYLLTFFVLYSITARVDNVSFGWPLQVHVGLFLGRGGFGVNLVGVGLLVWRRAVGRRDRAGRRVSAEPIVSPAEPDAGAETEPSPLGE